MISPSTLWIFQVTSEGVGLVLATLLVVQGGIQRCCHQCFPVQAPIPGTQIPPSCLLKMNWEATTGSKVPLLSPGDACTSQALLGESSGTGPLFSLYWLQVLLVPCCSSGSHSQCPTLGSPSGRAGWCQLPISAEGSGAKSPRGSTESWHRELHSAARSHSILVAPQQ